MKTSELTGAALDWAVANAKGYSKLALTISGEAGGFVKMHSEGYHNYSTDWAQGGPIIEREGMSIGMVNDFWQAHLSEFHLFVEGSTPLIAAMRCYVVSKLGDEIEIPKEILA